MEENSGTGRVVFLKGKKVNLRPPLKSDLPKVVQWINDPEVRHFVTGHFPQTELDEEEWLKNLSKNKESQVVLIIETSDGIPIGIMGLHRINWRDRVATTGALIGEKEYWGKGYGAEAKLLLLDYAFNILNLHKICSSAIAFNKRSLRYSLKCGYQEEGRLKRHIYRNGQYWDSIQLAIFREDFEPVWEKYQKET